MYITEIESWLSERYETTFVFHTDCFVIQALCTDELCSDQSDRQRAISILYRDEIPTNGLPENGNYIVIGTDVANDVSHSNCITIKRSVEKDRLCKELNRYIAEKAETAYKLACLNQHVLSDDFVEHLMDYLFELFQNSLMYIDYSHHFISYRQRESLGADSWDNAVKDGYYDPRMIDANFQRHIDMVLKSHSPYRAKLFEYDSYIWTIKNDTALYGFLIMMTTKWPLMRDDLHIINTAVDLMALKLRSNNDVSGKGDYSEILNDLLSENIKTEYELTYRMLTRSWKKSNDYQVLVIDLHGMGEKYAQYIRSAMRAVLQRSKHIPLGECEVILLEESSDKNKEFAMIIEYLTQYKLISGLSDTFSSLFTIKFYYEQAKKAILFGKQFGSESEVVFQYADYRFYDFLNECANSLDCDKYYHPITADLEFYDVEHKTEFFATLLTYLECGRSIHKTSEKMYLHKNTVNYRIQRIKELFNINYEDGQVVLFIYLSLKLYSMNRIKN